MFALNRKNTINKKQSIGITVVAVAVLSLLIAGTILAPTQASAISQRSVSVNRDHRDQHIGQENLCFRSNTCRQSDVGQNTLGNDNQVTGFADQSDNIPQAAAPTPVTPTNQTSANTNGTTTTPGTTINNFIDSSTTLFSLCSLFQVKNDTGTGNTQTGTLTCTVTITASPGAVGIGLAPGQTIAASNIIPRPATGCPAGSVEGIVTLPNGSTIAVCILV